MPSFLRLWLTHLWDQTRRKHGAIILIIDSKINQIIISLWMAFLDQQKKWVYYWEYFSSLTNVNVWSMHNQQVTWSDLLVLLLLSPVLLLKRVCFQNYAFDLPSFWEFNLKPSKAFSMLLVLGHLRGTQFCLSPSLFTVLKDLIPSNIHHL